MTGNATHTVGGGGVDSLDKFFIVHPLTKVRQS